MTEDLRFPVGRFDVRAPVAAEQLPGWIEQIADAPASLRAAVEGLSPEQLDTPYRPGGWTVRQVVHHLPDSHMTAYTRIKLALTDDGPAITPYDEDGWARLEDTRATPVEVSLALLDALHHRWVVLLRSLEPAQWERGYRHPQMGLVRVDAATGLYAWHGRHHVAHVTGLRERMGW
ncbi:MAG TPA: bacillithiol transferase BstA [Longimicrobiaceae bacterium]|nr:bacillithiol transferase BstA [Longimicrobiaceae bacterium]